MFKKINKEAILPQAKTAHSAGYDICADKDIVIEAGSTIKIPTGVCLDLGVNTLRAQKGYFLGLYLRSSLGAKGLILPNGVGVIDIDYKDEIQMIVHNPLKDGAGYENKSFEIKKSERIGQLIIQKHYGFEFLDDSYRKKTKRVGGIGSTNE